jgi:glycosyltransferase involved in cell wall biosynthesis
MVFWKKYFGVVLMKNAEITIITATLNAEKYLPRLIDSLKNQIDRDFGWVVVDGGSTDNTLDLIKNTCELKIQCLIGNDFGIYDALNRGLKVIKSGHYLVIGADDTLMPAAIKEYRAAINESRADIITASVLQGGRIVEPREGLGWLYGLPGMASSHAVGMVFNINLHQIHGMYSRKFPIAADQLFVKLAISGGATISRRNFLAGEFSSEGTSGSDPVGLLTEVFRVQLVTERIVIIQFILFGLRLWKLYFFSLLRLISFRFRPNKSKSN